MNIIRFVKDWTLPIAMIAGALSYVVYINIPCLAPTKAFAGSAVAVVQPVLIFCMLFLTFCKIHPRDLRPCRWHLWLLLIQALMFVLPALWLIAFPDTAWRVVIEGGMICMICPTATASAVVAGKLGGNGATLTAYIIAVNMLTAILAPLVLPMAHPHDGLSFLPAFVTILRKVFPMLICPLLLAWLVRFTMPGLHAKVLRCKDLAFYIWSVSLALAIAVTARSIHHNEDGNLWDEVGLAAVSLACCAFQFAAGRRIGRHYGEPISAGQALGQKNTVFIIWLGYTFLDPITSVAGGFYSVWHNTVNSYQLYLKRKAQQHEA